MDAGRVWRARGGLILAVLFIGAAGGAQAPQLLRNGSLEEAQPAARDAQGLVAGWQVGGAGLLPVGWILNNYYTGTFELCEGDAADGKRYGRLIGGPRGAHLYQLLQNVTPGRWHRITLWARGEGGAVSAYHYFQSGPMGGAQIGAIPPSLEWRRFIGYWQAPAENFANAALALSAPPNKRLEIDDVRIEPLEIPAMTEERAQKPAVFENSILRFVISPTGLLMDFTCKPLGKNYAALVPLSVVSVIRAGRNVPVLAAVAEGDRLSFRFLEPEIRLTLRLIARPLHFLLEVVEAQPEDVESLTLQLPIRRLAKIGAAFGATYDEAFGACCFCASVNAFNRISVQQDTVVLGGGCSKRRGLVGAKFVLIGAPAAQFKPAIIEAEKANGLPCPVRQGRWARDSESVRKSYLFATGVKEAQVETLIQYAKIGGFGTIIFLKDDWLATHGHYLINTRNFPKGLESVKRAVAKIHAAGLEAGVHVFGPSISPNDPYVTPKPDPRLAGVICPPLAEAIDERATTIRLAGPPPLPPFTTRTQATPGYHIQIGEEIIRYRELVPVLDKPGQWQFEGCVRGDLGTKAAAHEAGAPVKGLISLWGYFLVDPDSALAEEITTNFARVFKACGFDFVYFDASDGIQDDYLDRWYYLNKLHLLYFQKIGPNVLYQTSNGTGWDLCWHIIPRSASADGHGDIKGYLDERWPGILGMANNWTRADIGWYYWFRDVRPDQIEYVCAKALGVEGSISLETSVEACERLIQSRQMFEMIGRWERARRANVFGAAIKAKLQEMKRDFKLYEPRPGEFRLYRAAYEEPRVVDLLNGQDNVFSLQNPLARPCAFGFELVRPRQERLVGDYNDPQAKTIETFDEAEPYYASEFNQYEPFVVGDKKRITPQGIVREGVEFSFAVTEEARAGGHALRMRATNKGEAPGWTGIGRRFPQPLDLRGFSGLGLWIKGDGLGETIRIQLRDTAGRNVDWLPVINYTGWRLQIFPQPATADFDWGKVAYLLFYFNGLPPGKTAEVVLDDLKMLPALYPAPERGHPLLKINGQTVALPAFARGQALTGDGVGGVWRWPGGMKPGERINVPLNALQLSPGENRIEIGWSEPVAFPGDLHVLLYRVWELQKE